MQSSTFSDASRRWLMRCLIGLVACGALAGRGIAHEVDQYTLPRDKEFIDIGDYWNRMLYDAVHGAVEDTNFKIRQVLQLPEPARGALLAHYHSNDTLAWAVRGKLPNALLAIEGLEMKLRWRNLVEAPPGKIFGYRSSLSESIYSHAPLIPDPRQINRITFMRCSLVKVHDTYIGTDKMAHFIAMGFLYYNTYRLQTSAGIEPAQAWRQTVVMGEKGPIAEGGVVGMIPTGIYSNADMAANYLGMKFFLNLMEPVRLEGRTCEPMVVIRDEMLEMQPQVRPNGPFFARFIAPHMDEVLNPCLYEWGMRDGVRSGVKQRRQDILDWYAGDDPAKRNPEYFERLRKEYLTYYGEDYGHSGQAKDLVTVANTCFDQSSQHAAASGVASSRKPKPAAAPHTASRPSPSVVISDREVAPTSALVEEAPASPVVARRR